MNSGMIEQLERDNESLRYGVVNRCVGTLQLAPISFTQIAIVSVIALASVVLWMLTSLEVAIGFFALFSVTTLAWGGRDLNKEIEKMRAIPTYYRECPQEETGDDGLPCPVYEGAPYQLGGKNGKEKIFSLEREFREFRFYASREKEGARVGFYVLHIEKSMRIHFIYGFELNGFSPAMTHMESMMILRRISAAFKNLPDLEMKFIWSIPADASDQILQQKRLLDLKEQDPLTIKIINSKGKWATRLEKQGRIVSPSLKVFVCTKASLGEDKFIAQDWKDIASSKIAPVIAKFNEKESRQDLIIQAMEQAYDSCYRSTIRAFTEGMGLEARSLTVHDLYCRDHSSLHDSPVDRCPKYLRLTPDGLFWHEESIDTPAGKKPKVPHHILGELFKDVDEQTPSIPGFYRKDLYLPGKEKFASCVKLKQLEGFADIEGSHGLGHLQNTFRWIQGLHDVEYIVDIKAMNPLTKKKKLDDGLKNRTKRIDRAVRQQSQDVDAGEDIDDLIDARQMLRNGEKTLSTAVFLWVYRSTRDELSQAVDHLMGRIGLSNCELIQDSIQNRWIDSQPYAPESMCVKPYMQRQEYMIQQTPPILPFTQPPKGDQQGLFYKVRGISSGFLIDFILKKNHTLITAKSGGGKSMQGVDILSLNVATQTPAIVLDSPPLADQTSDDVAPSTYTIPIQEWQRLGVKCVYQDIKKGHFNILDRYGLGRSSIEIAAVLEMHLPILLAVVLGSNKTHPLHETIQNLLALSHKSFLLNWDGDVEPLLSDYLKHFVKWGELFKRGEINIFELSGIDGLGDFEASSAEVEAIAFIRSQILGCLSESWGQRINAQTDFDSDVLILVLGLTNIKADSKESIVYALAAQNFQDQIASRYPRCTSIMDEGTTLLKIDAFAARYARTFPEGRKKGINGILLATEIGTLLNSPYASDILSNFDTILVGNIEPGEAPKIAEGLHMKPEILRQYTDKPDLSSMSSKWYMRQGALHLELVYHTTPLLLALAATSPEEISVRDQFMKDYPDRLEGFSAFALALYRAYSQGLPVTSILKLISA